MEEEQKEEFVEELLVDIVSTYKKIILMQTKEMNERLDFMKKSWGLMDNEMKNFTYKNSLNALELLIKNSEMRKELHKKFNPENSSLSNIQQIVDRMKEEINSAKKEFN